MKRKVSLFSLVVLIISAIDNIRNLPAAAIFGTSVVFFFMFSAIVFLIPTSLVSAELSATFPLQGGIYNWVNKAFGKKWAMTAIWLQWINTMVWFPTMLSFIAGTLAYLINPDLVQNKFYLISCILVIFWGLTWVNLKGIHVSTSLNNIFVVSGTIFPLIFLIILGIIWVFSNHPVQIQITTTNLIPSLTESQNWISLIAIMASFLGMELSGVHVTDIHNPSKNFPKAVFFSCSFIFFSMLLGSLAIAFVLPESEISLVAGIMQLFSSFFYAFGLKNLIPVFTLLIVVGATGTMINWLISPARGLLHAAEFGFLPPFFAQKNDAGVASKILVAQGILVSFFSLVFLLVPSVNAFYWFLTALSTELYMIMYILMFSACIRLHYKYADRPKTFKIPGNHLGMWVVSLLGLIGCSVTILMSFFPPDNIKIGNPAKYFFLICIGNLVTISPLFFFFLYEKKKRVL